MAIVRQVFAAIASDRIVMRSVLLKIVLSVLLLFSTVHGSVAEELAPLEPISIVTQQSATIIIAEIAETEDSRSRGPTG